MTETRVYNAFEIQRIIDQLSAIVGCRKAKIQMSGSTGDVIVNSDQIDLRLLPLGVEALAIACPFGGLCFGMLGGRSDCALLLNEGTIKYVFEK